MMNLEPVAPEVYGEGYPYAPENWPEEGDVWGWRTGRRIVRNGTHFQDRYLYMPNRLHQMLKEQRASGSGSGSSTSREKHIFASKAALKCFVSKYFPDTDLDHFFSSFSWKIPALPPVLAYGNALPIAAIPLQQIAHEAYVSDGRDVVKCKAKNNKCTSLVLDMQNYSPVMPCDICCSEPDFCRDCCCILCSRTVSTDYGGYSYTKCQLNAGEGICGHVAHIECALRSYMAGKVGGSIGLDAQYYCRRCDGRTDMISHVNNLLQTCKTTALHDEIVKMLDLGACLLRGTEKPVAKKLLRRIELAISKLKVRPNLEDIWKEDDSLISHSLATDTDEIEDTGNQIVLFEDKKESDSYDSLSSSLKLEVDTNQFLSFFGKSCEFKYKMVEEAVESQKTYLQNLFVQLDNEKDALATGGQTSSASSRFPSSAVRERKIQMTERRITRERKKYETMKRLACSFSTAYDRIIQKNIRVRKG